MTSMNTSKIKVRLDAESRTAELEVMTPNGNPYIDGIDHALARMRIRAIHTVELSTPRYRVTRTKLAEMDGSDINPARLMQVLRAAQTRTLESHSFPFNRAA
jgi:hypothetical protein